MRRLHGATSRLEATLATTSRLMEMSADILDKRRADGRGRAGGDRLLSLAEVGLRTGRHPDLLRRWCLAGRIPAVRVGRSWAIPESRIDEIARMRRRRHHDPDVGAAAMGTSPAG